MDNRRVPPQSLEAEMSVLGGIFLENDAIDRVQEILSAEDFYRESHRKIMRSMIDLIDRNEPVDLTTLSVALKKSGELEEVGGGAYLATLVDYVPTAANIAYYCRIVAEKSQCRRLLSEVQNAAGMLYEEKPVAEVVERLESAMTQLQTVKQSAEPVAAKDALRETLKALERRHETRSQIQGIPYGIPSLDEATNGMQRGDLIVIAGRPSMGKSAFAGNVIESACSSGLSAILFSLEMSRQNCMERMISSHGEISYAQLRSGRVTDETWAKLSRVTRKIHGWKWHIDDTPGISLAAIRSKAKRLKRKAGLDLLVVDYLQLMSVPSRETRSAALGEISRGLKKLARELDVAVVLLSQLNRGVETRTDKRPTMADLRDSGEIEQDADVILFPFRPAAYCELCRDRIDTADHNLREHQAEAEIIIEKQRNGERNVSIPVEWIGDNQRFVPTARRANRQPPRRIRKF